MTCHNCNGELSKEDLYVFKRSTMQNPWCNSCVREEDKRVLEEEKVPGTPGLYRSLPRYLQ